MTITLTQEEANALLSCAENGWGDGDFGASLSQADRATCVRALRKLALATRGSILKGKLE